VQTRAKLAHCQCNQGHHCPKRALATNGRGAADMQCVLSLEEWNHGAHYNSGPDTELIGVFDSKAAAVAAAAIKNTNYGRFDEAINSMFVGGEYIDNRENPPDNGVLWKLGGRDIGEGDYIKLLIKKMPVRGLPDQKAAKRTSEEEEGNSGSRKKTKKSQRPKITRHKTHPT